LCYTYAESSGHLASRPIQRGYMSKLIDRLTQTAETVATPMGFRAAKRASVRLKMVLVARVEPADNTAPLSDYVSSADAVITTQINTGKDIARSLPGTVWGLWREGKGRQPIKDLVEAGADFAVLPLDAELDLDGTEKIGKILLVEPSLSEGLVGTINELPADAVLLADDQGERDAVTWHQLMLCQRFADLLSRPLLVTVPASVSGDELKALWKAGVDGLVVAVKTIKQAEKLKALRQIIDKTDFAARPRKKVSALLPHISEEQTAAPDVEEEE
jgi:hypothetical protein